MGDARREDRDRKRDDDLDRADDVAHDAEHDHDGDDGGAAAAHAATQRRLHAQPRARGMIDTDAGEHAYEGKGDQDALWTRFEAFLADGEETGWPLALVRDMDGEHRAMVAARLAEVARVTAGRDLLVIAELVHALPGATIDAVLACPTPPTRAQLRNFLGVLTVDDLAAELDRDRLARLRKAFPGDPLAIAPQLLDALHHAALATWFLNETPQAQVAMTLLRVDRPAITAAQLNRIGRGGWTWAFHVDDALTSIASTAVDAYAKATDQADVRSFLEGKVAARETRTVAEMSAEHRELEGHLRARQVDAGEVVGDLAAAEGFGADELRKPARRRAFLATADAAQIDQALLLVGGGAVERMEWMLDAPGVTAASIGAVVGGWPDEERDAIIERKLVAKMRRRFPGARPVDLFGRVPLALYGQGARDAVVRDWIVDGGEPHELLAYLTTMPGYLPERCAWMGKAGGGWDWLARVGGGTNDNALRAVALNCPDPAVVQRIHAELLGDYRETESEIVTPAPVRGRAFEDPNRNLERSLDLNEKGGELATRAGELRPEDVADLKADPARLAELIDGTQGRSLVRVLYLVQPPMKAVFARKDLLDPDKTPLEVAPLSAWLRERPAADVVDGLNDHATFTAVSTMFPAAPLELFPPLRNPAVLSQVIADDPERLRWILERSEPMSAMKTLGAAGAAEATVSALWEDEDLVEWLPSGKLLSPRDRTYLYSLYNKASGSLKQRLQQRIGAEESELESSVDARATGDDRKARDGAALPVAVEAILSDQTIPVEDLLTLCRERASEAAAFVTQHPAAARRALVRAGLSPQAVFDAVPLGAYFGADAALAEHVFDTVPGFLILRASAGDGALRGALARGLDAKQRPYQSWIRQMPTGSGLVVEEEDALAKLCAAVTTDAAARELFKCRFGAGADESYDRKDVQRLWKVLQRVPSAHRDQEAVAGYYEFDKAVKPLDGEFDPSTGRVGLQDGLRDNTGDNPLYNRQGPTTEMTRAEAMSAFSLTDEQLDQWVADKRMIRTGDVYRMAPAPQPDRFTGTALHEIGHAVDDRLGNQTELVYKLAGWKQYGEADFDAWATDLGGWNRVKPDDKAKIREAWMVWINSSKAAGRPGVGLHELVPYTHPAIADAYAGVGVVDLARSDQGSSQDPFLANGRAYIMNGTYQMMYSLPMRAVHAAPSAYGLTAPAEYFAECYMAYYLTSDGTPRTAAQKGTLLAPWIKQWFDVNVDRMSFNPNPRRDD